MDARVSQSEIPQVYDALSKTYDIWGKLAESQARNRAIELADIRNGQQILEVAVGTGLAFMEIVKKNPAGLNIGIDVSPGMLKKAQTRLQSLSGANYQLKLGDAFKIEAESQHFDLVMNSYMFDLIAFRDMDKILAEFRRVLKREGKLVLVNMTTGETFGSGLYRLIYRIAPKAFGGCRGVRLAKILQQNGFQVKTREYYQQLLFPSEVILALKKNDSPE